MADNVGERGGWGDNDEDCGRGDCIVVVIKGGVGEGGEREIIILVVVIEPCVQ